MKTRSDLGLPDRRQPARGVFAFHEQPTIVFVTVCTRNRVPWLAQDDVHANLLLTWRGADAWRVGKYVLMPDEKWEYVRQNPVRKGLVSEPEEWPYQGEVDVLRW